MPVTAVERKGRVLRHRGKRKNRRFKKTILYASRKCLQKLGRFVNCSILYFNFFGCLWVFYVVCLSYTFPVMCKTNCDPLKLKVFYLPQVWHSTFYWRNCSIISVKPYFLNCLLFFLFFFVVLVPLFLFMENIILLLNLFSLFFPCSLENILRTLYWFCFCLYSYHWRVNSFYNSVLPNITYTFFWLLIIEQGRGNI